MVRLCLADPLRPRRPAARSCHAATSIEVLTPALILLRWSHGLGPAIPPTFISEVGHGLSPSGTHGLWVVRRLDSLPRLPAGRRGLAALGPASSVEEQSR